MNDRPEPRFNVGEEVIVVGYSGEHRAEGVVTATSEVVNRATHNGNIYTGFGYKVDPPPEGITKFILQAHLRKKHPPATLSFDQMMADLKRKKPTIAELAERLRA